MARAKALGEPLTRDEMIRIASDIARNEEVGPTARLTALRNVQTLMAEAAEEDAKSHGHNATGPRVAPAQDPGSEFDALDAETEAQPPESAASFRVVA